MKKLIALAIGLVMTGCYTQPIVKPRVPDPNSEVIIVPIERQPRLKRVYKEYNYLPSPKVQNKIIIKGESKVSKPINKPTRVRRK